MESGVFAVLQKRLIRDGKDVAGVTAVKCHLDFLPDLEAMAFSPVNDSFIFSDIRGNIPSKHIARMQALRFFLSAEKDVSILYLEIRQDNGDFFKAVHFPKEKGLPFNSLPLLIRIVILQTPYKTGSV